jgi:hypothetical protein
VRICVVVKLHAAAICVLEVSLGPGRHRRDGPPLSKR